MNVASDPTAQSFQAGNQASENQDWQTAVAAYNQVLKDQPDHAWAHNNIGYCLKQLKRFDEAILHLNRAISLDPGNALAVANLALAYRERGDAGGAIPWWRRLTELKPEVASHWIDLGLSLMHVGRARESRRCYERALEIEPGNRIATGNMLLGLNYADDLSAEEVWREHLRLTSHWRGPRRPPESFSQSRSRDRDHPLRIGYLAADFYTHPVGKIIGPIIANHNRDAFEIHAYHDGQQRDGITEYIEKNCHAFTSVSDMSDEPDMSDEEVERRILADRIDILVELGGHTCGGNRLSLLAKGLAPVQVSFLGYPNTTGLTAIDYRLTDRFADPPGQTDHLYTEKLVRLERGFLCYEPLDDLPPATEPPCRERGFVTFGSFNNPSKISASTLKAWARILRATPGSRLLVKYGRAFESPSLRERWRDWIAAEGVDPARLDFRSTAPAPRDHLRAIGEADLCLDPFPYQGTMTTLEALSIGVPVMTLAGSTYSRRASSALLLRLGFPELVTEDVERYVAQAAALTSCPDRLANLRIDLRQRFFKSEIRDIGGFVQELEGVYHKAWKDWRRITSERRTGETTGNHQPIPHQITAPIAATSRMK